MGHPLGFAVFCSYFLQKQTLTGSTPLSAITAGGPAAAAAAAAAPAARWTRRCVALVTQLALEEGSVLSCRAHPYRAEVSSPSCSSPSIVYIQLCPALYLPLSRKHTNSTENMLLVTSTLLRATNTQPGVPGLRRDPAVAINAGVAVKVHASRRASGRRPPGRAAVTTRETPGKSKEENSRNEIGLAKYSIDYRISSSNHLITKRAASSSCELDPAL